MSDQYGLFQLLFEREILSMFCKEVCLFLAITEDKESLDIILPNNQSRPI